MTPEIIPLARRLHAAGGTKDWQWKEDDLAIHPYGDVSRVMDVTGDFLGFMEDDHPKEHCIPIPSCDELWAWLKEECRAVLVDMLPDGTCHIAMISICPPTRKVIPFNGSLHVALLTACVEVAEREA